MDRVLLCSMAVPWPTQPQLGIYHHLQARGLRELGVRMSLFSPAPRLPTGLFGWSRRARRHRARPSRYCLRGVDTHSPRVGFAFPPFVRGPVSAMAPSLVGSWAERSLGPALDEVIAEERPDVLLAHGVMPFGPVVSARAEKQGIPHAYIEHSADDVLRLSQGSPLGRFYCRHYAQASVVFTPSHGVLDHLRHALGCQNARFIQNGAVRPTPDQLRAARPDELEGKTVLLSAAQWSPRKGLEHLVTAFSEVAADDPDVVLVLVTDAPRSLRRQIDRRNESGQIRLRPLMTQSELVQWMVWADLFVLPSWRESFGLVYGESLAAGTPIVLGEDGGFAPHIVDARLGDGQGHGWLVPPRDPRALRGVLTEAVSDRVRLARLGANGRRLMTSRFRWVDNARMLLEELSDCGADCALKTTEPGPEAAPSLR